MAEVPGEGNPNNPIPSELFGNKTAGNEWKDGDYSQIKKITAVAEHGIFTGFQLDYVKDCKVIHGNPHGSKERHDAQIFDLNYPSEVLQKITGYCGIVHDILKIKSLIFTTTTREFPPVGVAAPTDTKFEIKGSNIVGLFGRDDADYVYAIGADYEP